MYTVLHVRWRSHSTSDARERILGSVVLQNSQLVVLTAVHQRHLFNTNRAKVIITEKECLAILFACHCFSYKHLSRRDKNTIESDHKPFQSIFKTSIRAALSRQQRMLIITSTSRFNLDVKYKPGLQIYRSPVKNLSCQQMRTRRRVPSVCLRGWNLKPAGLLHIFKWEISTATKSDRIRCRTPKLEGNNVGRMDWTEKWCTHTCSRILELLRGNLPA